MSYEYQPSHKEFCLTLYSASTLDTLQQQTIDGLKSFLLSNVERRMFVETNKILVFVLNHMWQTPVKISRGCLFTTKLICFSRNFPVPTHSFINSPFIYILKLLKIDELVKSRRLPHIKKILLGMTLIISLYPGSIYYFYIFLMKALKRGYRNDGTLSVEISLEILHNNSIFQISWNISQGWRNRNSSIHAFFYKKR